MRASLTFALTFACLTLALPRPSRAAEEVTLHERDMIEESMAKYLVRPETALWRFTPKKPYLGTTKVVCGTVNYQSSERTYVGYHRFYALLDDGQVTLSQIEDKFEDPSGRLADKLDYLCGKG